MDKIYYLKEYFSSTYYNRLYVKLNANLTQVEDSFTKSLIIEFPNHESISFLHDKLKYLTKQ